jgi:uncharacterized protein (TIGR02145 family)
MKRLNILTREKLFLFIFLALIIPSCEKPGRVVKLNTLDTDDSEITFTTAILKGEVTDHGFDALEDHGFFVSEYTIPVQLNSVPKSLGPANSVGVFQALVTNLSSNNTYYFRAYATVKSTIIYGDIKQFTTKQSQIPTVEAGIVTEISPVSAKVNGNILSDGGMLITKKGLCWNTTANPSLSDCLDTTVNGSGTGAFTGIIEGLSPVTQYYARVYATNSNGTAYNDADLIFTTSTGTPKLVTTAVSAEASTSACSGGVITTDGGASISQKGICWSSSDMPTIEDDTSVCGSGSDAFISSLSGLLPNTAYNIRAYATNSAGTGYGNQLTFTTPAVVTDYDGNIYNTVRIGSQLWMQENLKVTHYREGSPIYNTLNDTVFSSLVVGAYSWYNNDESTYKNPYGALYNFYAIADSRNLCPSGWHVPLKAEWTSLASYLGGASVTGGKIKEAGFAHWPDPNLGADNSSGFTALPGGVREGGYALLPYNGRYWTSSAASSNTAYAINLHYTVEAIQYFDPYMNIGFSVRCMKD